MSEPTSQSPPTPANGELPSGDHPLEVAARAGIGPLSAMSQKVWHGEATPCVSCGQLVRRNSSHCGSCGQDLTDEMIAKMRKHAGPWDVLEHLRPFPGVTLDRILLQVRRGLITPTSIVRGPATDYQWRFAVETPGLCRLFGRCWNCFHGISNSEAYCPRCLSHLGFEKPVPMTTSVAAVSKDNAPRQAIKTPSPPSNSPPAQPMNHDGSSAHLDALATAAQQSQRSQRPAIDEPARVGPLRAGWIAFAIVLLVLASLVGYTTIRSGDSASTPPEQAATAPTLKQ